MARQVRIEFAGATYHVMCRGDRREAIFADDEDRAVFLGTLGAVVKRAGWRVHGYVLMSNHYHLVIETPEPNLVRGMTWVQTTYTARYNARHRCSGHLFGGRYKAVVVEAEEPRYLRTLLDYIHLNAVRAGLVQLPEGGRLLDYPWSSLNAYCRVRGRPEWLTVERGFGAMDLEDTVAGRRRLLEDLERRAAEGAAKKAGLSVIDEQNLQATLRRGWYYGRQQFRDWLLEQADELLRVRGRKRKNYHGSELRDHHFEEARRLITAGLREEGLRREDLSALAKGDLRKARIAHRVKRTTLVPLQWLADELRMGTAANLVHARRRVDRI